MESLSSAFQNLLEVGSEYDDSSAEVDADHSVDAFKSADLVDSGDSMSDEIRRFVRFIAKDMSAGVDSVESTSTRRRGELENYLRDFKIMLSIVYVVY